MLYVYVYVNYIQQYWKRDQGEPSHAGQNASSLKQYSHQCFPPSVQKVNQIE